MCIQNFAHEKRYDATSYNNQATLFVKRTREILKAKNTYLSDIVGCLSKKIN